LLLRKKESYNILTASTTTKFELNFIGREKFQLQVSARN